MNPNMKLFCIVLVQLIICSNGEFLTFPPSSPTRLQMIAGFGIPVDLELESVTVGYVFKTEYWLPVNASNYLKILGHPFDPTPNPITTFGRKLDKRNVKSSNMPDDGNANNGTDLSDGKMQNIPDYDRGQKYERYDVDVIEIEQKPTEDKLTFDALDNNNDEEVLLEGKEGILEGMQMKEPNNLATSRWALYKGMERLVGLRGLNGRPCVLRTICESAQAPFSYSGGILSELMHIVLSPSSTTDELIQHSDNEYLRAEEMGMFGAPCAQVFRECQRSILDEISEVYSSMENVFRSIG